ncbi:pectate lyase-like adhesive domain-containing protein [Enterococcus sp. LJL51]|uniref:pectate lyase-like adhesive domain-containing protein n=1 Tax=Enterococcus sp. LJL51 TaxID=3416656 RepID=UPI003CF3FC67
MKFGKSSYIAEHFVKLVGIVVFSFCFSFIGAEKAQAAPADVNDWGGFVNALQDPNVSEINLSGSFAKTTTAPGSISRDITINGNGFSINFGTGTPNGVILGSVGQTTTLTLNNVDIHKYTTPGTATFSGDGANWIINVNNVTTGTQTTAAQSGLIDAVGATVNISGTNNKFRMYSAADLSHIKAKALNIADGANVTFAQSNYRSSIFTGETVVVGKNAVVDMGLWTINGTASANDYGFNASTSVLLDEGSTVKTGAISGNYSKIINTGTFTAKTGSLLETTTSSTYTSVITASGDVVLETGATVKGTNSGANNTQIDAAGAVNVMSGATLDLTASGVNTTQVKSNAAEFIVRNGANLNVEYTNTTNTTSYSFYVNKFVVEDNATFKLTPTGTGHRIYGTGFTVGTGADVEIASNSANSDAAIFLMGNAEVLVKENAKVAITNNGTAETVTANANYASGAEGSHGIYGLISKFTVEPNARVNINANTIGYWVRGKNELNMSGGAYMNVHSKIREALALSYDFGDGAHTDKPATINISGAGTKLDMSSDNVDFTMNDGATMRVQGDGSVFNLKDGAELYSTNVRTSALQMQSQNSVFNVTNGAKMHLIKDSAGATNYTLGATLRFRIRGTQTFNIDGGQVIIENKNSLSFGIRMYGDNNHVNVTNAGQLRIINEGNSGNAVDSDKGGIQYTGTGSFNLEGKDSLVDISADQGPAIYSSSTLGATVGPGAIYILEGRTNSNNEGGAINAGTLSFDLDAPKYFDLRNNRSGGGYALSGGSSSVMTSKNSDLSVWKSGSNLDGNPFRAWSIFDYKLTGANFRTIADTNVPLEFNTNVDSYGSVGAQAYSRMSANNASAVIDELRVPTNADKYFYGHASVPEGLDDIRDAWTDEVYVEVEVKNPDGSRAFTTTVKTIGKDDSSPGLSVYGEAARGGMFVVPMPNGEFVKEGMTIEVLAAWRGGADSTSNRVHVSGPDDIKTGVVEAIDVTPPTQAVSTENVTNATKQLKGTSDEDGAKVFVKVNGSWLKDDANQIVSTTVSGGAWTLNLPGYINKTDKVDIYLKDTTEINPEPTYTLPVTYTQEPDGVYGNINEEVDGYDAYVGYHDAVKVGNEDDRFDEALRKITADVLPDNPDLKKSVVSSGGATTSVGDELTYTLTVKNDKADSEDWTGVVLEDTLAAGMEFDSTDHGITIKQTDAGGTVTDVPLQPDTFTYEPSTRVLSIKVGDIPALYSYTVTFKTTVNNSKVGVDIKNTADANGYSPQEDNNPFIPGPINPAGPFKPITVTSNEIGVPGGEIHGTLQLISAPTSLEFGSQKENLNGKTRVEKPTVVGSPLVVSDNRGNLDQWKMLATLTTPFTNGSQVLPNALKYKAGNNEYALTGVAQEILIHTHNLPGDYDITQNEWTAKGDGFVFEVPAGSIKKLGSYQAKLLFTLTDAK